ncbi:MAG: TRAFAC clade GTPase domain-containing protein [Terriglobales bacterium]
MKNLTHNHFLLIGLPNTGKTSFLAALWYMVGQSAIPCALKLEKLDGESQYLNQIRDTWLEYKPVPRNKADTEKPVAMWLRNRETDEVARLTFPDLSGEAFRSQWTQRQLATTFDKSLAETRGGLLFVNPENILKPHRIDTVNAVLDDIGGDTIKRNAKGTQKPWDSEKSPTQVQLVEVLQFMAERGHFRSAFRLAVVVSAWDRINDSNVNPSDWIAAELPLLKQFLESNEEMFEPSFYGISAQGGRYALPHFWPGNFNNSQVFAKRLYDRADTISAWIWEKLDSSSQSTLDLLRNGAEVTQLQKKALAKDFNRLMAEPDFYDETRYANVELRPETESWLRNGILQNEEKKFYLTRLLVEDAYPNELSRDRENEREASDLQQKLPARRVLVVDDQAKMSHDVTEPIRWLMH